MKNRLKPHRKKNQKLKLRSQKRSQLPKNRLLKNNQQLNKINPNMQELQSSEA
jgi:hypothetical protein